MVGNRARGGDLTPLRKRDSVPQKQFLITMNSNAAEFRVVTNAARYVLERPAAGWPANPNERAALATRLLGRLAVLQAAAEQAAIKTFIRTGAGRPEEIVTDVAMQTLAAELNWTYRKEPR